MTSLCCSIFESRLKERAQKVDFTVYGISVDYGPYFKSPMADDVLPRITSNREALTIKVRTKPDNVYQTLDFIVHEAERVDRYGFSTSEYQYANSQYWKNLNRKYYFRKSLSNNDYYSDMCISNFLNGTSLASIELKHLYMSKINVPDTLYSSQINSFIRLLDNPERDALITISLPNSAAVPDHDRLVGTYVTALASPCDTTHDVNADSLLFKLNIPVQKQSVVKESIEPSTGAAVWTLPNGATVVCKNSDTTRGRFLFKAFGKGGASLAEGTAAKWRQRLGDITPICKVCGYDAFDMDMLMAGKDVELVSGMNVYSEFLSGEGSTDGLDAFMRLMYMNFTSRAEDTLAFKAYARNNDVPMSLEDYRECFNFISSRFSNASNFIFVFVGDLDIAKLKALGDSYIATLPSTGVRSNWKALPSETFSATDKVGRIVYKSPIPYGKENYLLFNVTRSIIDSYLCSKFGPSGVLVSAGGDMKHYIVQIDSLNTLNTALREDAASSKKVAEEKTKQYDELKTTTDELGKQVSAGAIVRGRGISLTAINTAGKSTDRSSRVDKLKACVNLVENAIAKKGDRSIYIRVKDPEGILMTEDQQKVFECSGEQMIYSATREVDYEGDEIEICVFFGAGQKFVKGAYTVDIYTNECKLGSADLMLR